jgi:hypothetical protein
MTPRPKKPKIIIPQVEGSGTAATLFRGIAEKVCITEAEDVELIGPASSGDEIIIIGDPKRMFDLSVEHDVLPKCDPFDFCRYLVCGDTMRRQCGYEIQERSRFCDSRILRSRSRQISNVGGIVGIDNEELFDRGRTAVAETLAVALVDQELVVVDGDDVADADPVVRL